MAFAHIFKNIIRNSLLRWIVLLSFFASIVTPLFLYQYLVPLFYEQMMQNIIIDANKLGHHLFKQYAIKEEGMVKLQEDIEWISRNFTLERIKFFDAKGQTLFSSNAEEINTFNTGDAFKQRVSKGENVYKIVPKGHKSVDGRLLNKDVAEIYLPIMQKGNFEGAFEIYYDITEKRYQLDQLIERSMMILAFFSLSILSALGLIVLFASKRDLQTIEAQKMVESLIASLEEKVSEQTQEIRFNKEISIEAIAALAEDYDDDTGKHIRRIKNYTILIATWLKENHNMLNTEQIDDMAMASILHDIGKLSIPKSILNKPGKLDEAEWEVMRTHAQKGAEVLERANKIFFERFGKNSYLAVARDIARYHHEKYDGSGYPEGLRGEDIPLAARIVALVDVYDALRGKRPYKRQWSHQDAYELIVSGSHHHFHPLIVEAFKSVADAFDKTYLELADT